MTTTLEKFSQLPDRLEALAADGTLSEMSPIAAVLAGVLRELIESDPIPDEETATHVAGAIFRWAIDALAGDDLAVTVAAIAPAGAGAGSAPPEPLDAA